MANEFYTRPQQNSSAPLYEKGINTGSEIIDYGQKIGKGIGDVVSMAPESAAVGIAIVSFWATMLILGKRAEVDGDSILGKIGSNRLFAAVVAFGVATLGHNAYLSSQGITVRGSEQSYRQIDGRSALPVPSGYNQLSNTFEEPSKGARGKQPPGKPFECFAPDPSKHALKNC